MLDYLKVFNIKLCTKIEEIKYMEFVLFQGKNCLKIDEVINAIYEEAKCRDWKYYVER